MSSDDALIDEFERRRLTEDFIAKANAGNSSALVEQLLRDTESRKLKRSNILGGTVSSTQIDIEDLLDNDIRNALRLVVGESFIPSVSDLLSIQVLRTFQRLLDKAVEYDEPKSDGSNSPVVKVGGSGDGDERGGTTVENVESDSQT